jgi:D-ribose pyranase
VRRNRGTLNGQPARVMRFVPHVEFKQATAGARAAVRGQFTPYANVLVTAGVVY